MERDDKSSGGVPGGGLIVVVLLAVGAFVVSKPPLESFRPATTQPHLERREAPQDIDARLWQDPFGAVARAREQPRKSPDAETDEKRHSEKRFVKDLQRQAQLTGSDDLFIVAVMLFSGPYAEQVESRRRMRYAVLAGLQARSFIPVDTEHLGYFYPYDGQGPQHGLPETVPFEIFEHDPYSQYGCARCRLVVLWLDSAPFYDQPLSKLHDLAKRLAPADATGQSVPNAIWRVLGPASSDGLSAVIAEVYDERFNTAALKPFHFRFFSSGATAPDESLLPKLGPGETSKNVSEYLTSRDVPLVRTIGTDDRLAEALKAELKNRGLIAKSATCPPWRDGTEKELPDEIAIIAEGDTLYGRSLRQQFGASKGEGGFCVTRWHYFRGIDGRLPGDAAPQTSDSRNNKKESKPDSAEAIGRGGAYIERAEGMSQFDYLRRLAGQIRKEDERLRRENPEGGGIRAIGVLGNDVYDKLLVLQALHPEIPHAVFFTTDLDARFFHPREQDWARNLIVASSFGLTLSGPLQRATAPFRDSYQTAAYLATLMLITDVSAVAKDSDAAPLWKQEEIDKWFVEPRLFEVTRSNVFNFNPHRDKDVECNPWDLRRCDDIHPGGSRMWPNPSFPVRWLIFALATAALWVPAVALYRNGRRRLRRFVAGGGPSKAGRLRRMGVLLVAFVALAVLPALLPASHWPIIADWMTQGKEGKPLSFTDGISPWPTYLIRFATCAMCLYFIWHAWVVLRSNVDRIVARFRLGSTRRRLERDLAKEEKDLEWWQRLVSMFDVRFRPGNSPPSDVNETTMTREADAFWMHYIVQNRFRARFLRTSLGVAVVVVVSGVIWMALGKAPPPPQRGTLADFGLHIGSILPTALAAQFLIFFVVDATLLCVLFMRGLRLQVANWPWRTLATFKARLGVPTQYLQDWIDLQFVARRTRYVAALIYYPFIVLSLMIVARSSFFDDWDTPKALYVVMMLSFGIVVACAFTLRLSAEASRRQALTRVRDAILRAKGETGNPTLASQLDTLRDRIEKLRVGAFAPYSQQPLLKAVLLPVLTFGGTSLFDYLALLNL